MDVMKCLANFTYDFPRTEEKNKELHCFISDPSHWGTEIFIENRDVRNPKIHLKDWKEAGGRYAIDQGGYYIILPASLEGIDNVFDDGSLVPRSTINDYFKFLAHLRHIFGNVDILNALSICRHFEIWYSRVWFNISKWTEYYNNFLNKFRRIPYTENLQFGPLHLSNTEAKSATDKIEYVESFPKWFETIKVETEKDPVNFSHIFKWIREKTYTIDKPISSEVEFKKVKVIVNAQIALSSLSLLKLNLFKEEDIEGARDKILQLAPKEFKEAGIDVDLEKFLRESPSRKELYDIFKGVRGKILHLIKELRKPLPDPEQAVVESYYRRLGETKAIQITREKVQKGEWQYVVIVQADLHRYSDHGGFASYACGILKTLFEGFCKQYNGILINPDAGDAFVGLFGECDKAIEFATALKASLKEKYDKGKYYPKTVRAKSGISVAEFSYEFSEETFIQAMGVAADCSNLGKYEDGGYKNEGDIVTNESFVDFLDKKGIKNLNIQKMPNRKIKRKNQKEETYKLSAIERWRW
jgi:hypothetical protein